MKNTFALTAVKQTVFHLLVMTLIMLCTKLELASKQLYDMTDGEKNYYSIMDFQKQILQYIYNMQGQFVDTIGLRYEEGMYDRSSNTTEKHQLRPILF